MLDFSNIANVNEYLHALKNFSFEEIFRRNRMLPTAHKTSEIICVENLLTIPIPLDAADKNGVTMLMWASAHGHCDIVDLLLTQGANPELHDRHGETALMKASYRGQLDVVKLLLAYKVNIENVDSCGHTALASSIYLYTTKLNLTDPIKFYSVIKMLLDHGANAQVTYSIGGRDYSLINLASKEWSIDILKLLTNNLKQTNDVNLFDDEFIFAINRNFVYGVQRLLAINPTLLDRHQNCVYLAVNPDIVAALLEVSTHQQRQRLFNYQGRYGHTPLLLAFKAYSFAIVKQLLNFGDDVGKILLFAQSDEESKLRLREEPWLSMLQEYTKNVIKYETTPTLTEKSADFIYQEAQRTATNLLDLNLPIELLELCSQTPERKELYSRYRPSSQTRELLINGPLTSKIVEPATKRRRM